MVRAGRRTARVQVLRAEKRRQRESAQHDEGDDDDDEDDDEGEAALKAVLNAGEPTKDEPLEAGEEGRAKEEASAAASVSSRASSLATTPPPGAAPGKRKNSPVPAEEGKEGGRNSKQQRRQKVQERDVVLVIHEHGRMQLKDLVAKFKPLMSAEKADKDQFMAIVKKVAKLVNDGGSKFVTLNDSILEQYGLATA